MVEIIVIMLSAVMAISIFYNDIMKSSLFSSSNILPKWAAVFCLQGMFSVAAGAFAAHALEGVLTPKE